MLICIKESIGYTLGKKYNDISTRELSKLSRIGIIDNRGKQQDWKTPQVYEYFKKTRE